MEVCEYSKCTGCMACINICPKNVISVGEDVTYKPVPVIDQEKCISCDLCKKVCPQLNSVKLNSSQKCYAVGAKENFDAKECASAGVSAAFCDYVIQNGGYVFGVGYDSDGNAAHKCVSTKEEAEELKGSKYVQSKIGYAYSEVKELLKNKKNVLFIGTPCQIAGLYGYLRDDYDNLITVDLICHGTPSPRFLKDYLLEIGLSRWTKVQFRGSRDYRLIVYDGDKILYDKDAAFDWYYRAFYNNIILRNNCFSCKYTSVTSRPADISIGDFWGLDRKTLKIPINGKASVVLVNTEKGSTFFKSVDLLCEERSINEAVVGNAQLSKPSRYNSDAEVFINNYHMGFMKAVKKTCVRENIRENKKNYVITSIKRIIKRG